VDIRDPSRRLIACTHCGFRLPISQALERLQMGTTVTYRMWCRNCWRDFEGLELVTGVARLRPYGVSDENA
jgi:DNA-directed RNA polymerase subunit RPC12/RpoP